MGRARGNSLVQNIASNRIANTQTKLPGLLADDHLINQLQKLSLAVYNKEFIKDFPSDNTTDTDVLKEVEVEVVEDVIVDEKAQPNKNDDNLQLNNLKNGNDKKYDNINKFLVELDNNINKYDTILNQTTSVKDQINLILNNFQDVSEHATAFIDKTKDINEKYTELNKFDKDIPEVLKYFDSLDQIMRRLKNSSSLNIVRKDSFKKMLKNIDNSLIFLDEHPNFKDSENYRIKFKHCLIRSCELITHYLISILKKNFEEVNEKLNKNNNKNDSSLVSSTTRDALLYNKFSNISEEFNTQVMEIIIRLKNPHLKKYSNELWSLINQCYDNYFQIRLKLLNPILWAKLKDIIEKDKAASLTKFIQNTKSYFQQICEDEFKLFTKFFDSDFSRTKINHWLMKLCEPLYDTCRIRILRETDISILCDSVTLFGQYYEFEEGSEEYNRQFKDIQFDKIFEPILQRVQARLILKTQIYVENYIIKYQPTNESFMISNRKTSTAIDKSSILNDPLTKAYFENFKNNIISIENSSDANNENNDIANKNEDEKLIKKLSSYYPPLIMSLALLSKIYEMVNSVIFDDLAHHIVHDCLISLRKAFDMMERNLQRGINERNISSLDGRLSYLKNLLMLRDQIQTFNIEYTVNETYLDFSGVEEFFRSFTQKNDNSIQRSDSSMISMARELVPKVVKNMVDARSELISELRTVIKYFTDGAARCVFGDTTILKEGELDAENLVLNNNKLQKNVEEILPKIYDEICLFIDDQEIVANLMDAIQLVLIQSYNEYFEQIRKNVENGKIKRNQVNEMMDNDVFSEFVNNINLKLVYRQEQ